MQTASKGRHVERDVIMLCARWCCRYKLSKQAHDQHAVKQQQMKEDEADTTKPDSGRKP